MSYKQNFRDVGAPDTFLSNFSVSYWQDTSLFVGTRYFPVVPVNQAAGKFLTYPKGYFGRPVNSKRAEDGVANTIGYKTKNQGYTVDERGKEYRLLDRQNPRLLGDDMAFIHPVGAA
jgi:hypothetical protein